MGMVCGPNLEEILTYTIRNQVLKLDEWQPGLGEGENGSYCLMGAKFSFSINSSGDDSEAVAQQKCALIPLNSGLRIVNTLLKKIHLT